MSDRDVEHRKTALLLLQRAQQEAQQHAYHRAIGHLENAVWSAASARDADILLALIGELRSLAPKLNGGNLRRVSSLLEEATGYQARFGSEVPGAQNLQRRLHALLMLLLYGSDAVTAGDRALKAFGRMDPDGLPMIELNFESAQWLSLLTAGYEEGYKSVEELNLASLRDAHHQIKSVLKSLAVDLITAGAEVRGLDRDAVPLISFALLHGQVPLSLHTDGASSHAEERMNDFLLRIADEIASMSGTSRLVFIDTYRLAVTLGVSQRYAEDLSLTVLSV